jgi:hypothetical protein
MEPAQTLIDCEEEEEEAEGKVVDDKMLSTLVCAICQAVFHTPVSLVIIPFFLFRFFFLFACFLLDSLFAYVLWRLFQPLDETL